MVVKINIFGKHNSPNTIPIAIDLEALSPPTSALLCVAALKAFSIFPSSEKNFYIYFSNKSQQI